MNSHEALEQRILSRPAPDGFPPGAIAPDYDGLSIVALHSIVEHILGLEPSASALLDEIGARLPTADRLLLLIIDGLGHRALRAFCERYPNLYLSRLAGRGVYAPITSVFPSTTVAALTTYSTGLTPQEHGMLGYRLYLRETSAITNMIKLSVVGNDCGDSALRAGLQLDGLLPRPTVYERLRAHGIVVHTLLPRHIAESGLSKLLYTGSSYIHAAVSLPDMLTTARRILESAQGKTFLTLYWPGLDSIAHVRGPDSEAFEAEFRTIDAVLERELEGRVERTVLLVSSDHGFVRMRPEDYLSVGDVPALDGNLLLPPVGEPRASYLFLRSGEPRHPSDRGAGDGLVIVPSRHAIDAGLFGSGTSHPEIARRTGDLLAVSTGPAGLFHPYPDAVRLRGMHGGMTPDEMLVPLLVSSLGKEIA